MSASLRALVATQDTLRRWRSGPRWWFVAAAMIDSEAVELRREQVLQRLGPWVRPLAPRQAHVTVAALGFHPRTPQPSDPHPMEREVRLHIGEPDLFASAVYLRVDDPDGALNRWRDAFRSQDQARSEPWVAHVTAGVFARPVLLDDVRARLAALRGMPPLEVTARLRLMAVDTRSDVGAMRPVESLPGHDAVSGAVADSRTLRRGGFA